MKVSFYSEYYLSILITVDLKLDFDIAYGVGETSQRGRKINGQLADFQENHYFQNRPFQF